MRSVIQQSVVLPAAPEVLFDMYLDPEQHAAFTGHPVTIGAETGAGFSAFDGLSMPCCLTRSSVVSASERCKEWEGEAPAEPPNGLPPHVSA